MGCKHSKEGIVARNNTTAALTPNTNSNYETEIVADVIGNIGEYLSSKERLAYAIISQSHPNALLGYREPRNVKITKKLLSAVAYGMESKTVNIPMKPSDTNGLFNPNLFAEDLLKQSPEFLLERALLTDWAGRTFTGPLTSEHPEGEGITAFEYALWAKDFKMIEMMLSCIPKTSDGDKIRAALLKQYNQVKAPIEAGGGLTYILTYDWPVQDENGIPIKDALGLWQTTAVTETHTENHFDVTPLLRAYQNYDTKFHICTWAQRDASWIKIIGTLQRLLPIHLLQRYCDPNTSFLPVPEFTGDFKRSTRFLSADSNRWPPVVPLLSSSLSTDFALFREYGSRWNGPLFAVGRSCEIWFCKFDLAAVQELDKISTTKIETNIKQQLTSSAQSQTQLRT